MRSISDPGTQTADEPRDESTDRARTFEGTTDRALLRSATLASTNDLEATLPIASEAALVQAADRYRTREVLGSGGMGEVRLCHDAALGRDVALKTLLSVREGHTEGRRRFLREARVQGQLEHPSTVPVYDLGADASGALYFTMRRVRGHTLSEILSALSRGDATMTANYSRRKLLSAFTRVCLAIDYAHARGVLHRDLKPSNVTSVENAKLFVPSPSLASGTSCDSSLAIANFRRLRLVVRQVGSQGLKPFSIF